MFCFVGAFPLYTWKLIKHIYAIIYGWNEFLECISLYPWVSSKIKIFKSRKEVFLREPIERNWEIYVGKHLIYYYRLKELLNIKKKKYISILEENTV